MFIQAKLRARKDGGRRAGWSLQSSYMCSHWSTKDVMQNRIQEGKLRGEKIVCGFAWHLSNRANLYYVTLAGEHIARLKAPLLACLYIARGMTSFICLHIMCSHWSTKMPGQSRLEICHAKLHTQSVNIRKDVGRRARWHGAFIQSSVEPNVTMVLLIVTQTYLNYLSIFCWLCFWHQIFTFREWPILPFWYYKANSLSSF